MNKSTIYSVVKNAKSMSKVVDLFCGAGGFSLSAKMAGFEVGVSVDIDPDLTSKYKHNFQDANLLLADVAELKGKDLIKQMGSRPIGMIGGPPCQGFSLIGKRDKQDPRNQLLYHFFRLVNEVQPDFFVMENVPGLISSESSFLLDEGLALISNKYKIAAQGIFNAADYGAATNRRRFIITGYNPRYADNPSIWKKSPSVSVAEAISDLPLLENLQMDDEGYVYGRYQDEASRYARFLRRIPTGGVNKEVITQLKSGYVSGCNPTEHTIEVKKRFKSLKEGQSDPISRYVKLKWQHPSITLRAGTGRDKGSFPP